MDTHSMPVMGVDGSGDPNWHCQTHPRVLYMYLKHIWSEGRKGVAIGQMKCLASLSLSVTGAAIAAPTALSSSTAAPSGGLIGLQSLLTGSDGSAAILPIARLTRHELEELRVRTHLRLGQWQQEQAEEALQANPNISVTRYSEIFAPGEEFCLRTGCWKGSRVCCRSLALLSTVAIPVSCVVILSVTCSAAIVLNGHCVRQGQLPRVARVGHRQLHCCGVLQQIHRSQVC